MHTRIPKRGDTRETITMPPKRRVEGADWTENSSEGIPTSVAVSKRIWLQWLSTVRVEEGVRRAQLILL